MWVELYNNEAYVLKVVLIIQKQLYEVEGSMVHLHEVVVDNE